MSKNILLITTVYRTGEKIYPIIEKLSSLYSVDILNLFQMSNQTSWPGNYDPRQTFYDSCDNLQLTSWHGPAFHKDKDVKAKRYSDFFDKFERKIDKKYDLIIIDNNVTIKGGQLSRLYKIFKKHKAIVVGCPHGNREFKGYKVCKHIGGLFDYSFVFGKKDRSKLLSVDKKYRKLKSRLLCGGIPSNDNLINYKRSNKYILVITNFTEVKQLIGQVKKFKAFTIKEFEDLKLPRLARHYECPIVIKEKNKSLIYKSTQLRKDLRSREDVTFIMDCEDDNQLISDARCVISAPSTMSFKSIQMGIPTVLMDRHGMLGNFYDFPGLLKKMDWKHLHKLLHKQEIAGKCVDFINNTLSGGLDFISTDIYIKHIGNLLTEVKN